MELARSNLEFHRGTFVEVALSWTRIPKTLKYSMVESYVSRKAKEAHLSREETRQLRTLVLIGLRAGIFNKDNITLSGHSISNISHIYRDENTGHFFIDPNLLKEAAEKHEREDRKSLIPKLDLAACPDPIYLPIGVNLSKEWIDYIKVFNQTFPVTMSHAPAPIMPGFALSSSYPPYPMYSEFPPGYPQPSLAPQLPDFELEFEIE
jgi:hypothetical protein